MQHTPSTMQPYEGLWKNNPGLVQLLGLCPLLAITTSLVNGFVLGIATLLTLLISNTLISFARHLIPYEIRIPTCILIIASIVTAIELAMQAFFYDLYAVLGLFIPLIVTNCVIMARAEAFASRNTVPRAAMDALYMGIGFTLVLILLGALREIIGSGTLFSNAQLLLGDAGHGLLIKFSEHYSGFLLMLLPPGAFMGLAVLIAIKQHIDQSHPQKKTNQEIPLPHPARQPASRR